MAKKSGAVGEKRKSTKSTNSIAMDVLDEKALRELQKKYGLEVRIRSRSGVIDDLLTERQELRSSTRGYDRTYDRDPSKPNEPYDRNTYDRTVDGKAVRVAPKGYDKTYDRDPGGDEPYDRNTYDRTVDGGRTRTKSK